MPRRQLSETKQGRFVIICVVGGTLLIAVAVGNLVLAHAADATADDVRGLLRDELSAVSDDAIAAYPGTGEAIELRAVDAVAGETASVLGTAQRGDQVVVAVQAGAGWQVRCVEAELRGDATVLTYVRSGRC